MHSRIPMIALTAVAAALGLVTTSGAVADVTFVQSAASAGEPIRITFSPEGFLSAKHRAAVPLSGNAVSDESDDASAASQGGADADGLQILSSSGDVDIANTDGVLSILMGGSGDANVSMLRHDDSSSTKVDVDIRVNDEPLPASELDDNDIRIETENTGTLDGKRNENEVEIDRNIDIDVENDNDSETDIDRDIEAGDNDIEGEEQEVGDIRPGTVKIDLRGVED
ncbi:hypothetical protein HY374_01730 [Candidatus Berkelbacteria bacterium]|nr:hypothetical protein [Candidatus Berkelbacteria bacterium]